MEKGGDAVQIAEQWTLRSQESYVDVLVVGAGPAGLMCANALKSFGIDVRIVDKRHEKVRVGQADGVQPGMLEVFQSYGLSDRLFREGTQLHRAVFYNRRPGGGIEPTSRSAAINAPTARYKFLVTLHQGSIEAIFLDSMKSMALEVERSVAPVTLECSADPVRLSDPDSYPVRVAMQNINGDNVGQFKSEVIHAKYVLGADGAHSWVRKMLGISMDGEQTNYVWGVLDLVPDTDFPDIRNWTSVHSHHGSCLVIPREGDTIRLYLQLTGDQLPLGEDGRVNMSATGPDKLLEVAKKSFYPYRMEARGEIEWWTIYIIGQRVASKFCHSERIFIAGDACHTHSPKAGQGMNASMSDSHNLAWKLALVLRGLAKPSILETYEFERRKFACDLINFDREWAALFSQKMQSHSADNEDRVSHAQFTKAFKTFGGFTSGIGIHYAPSPLTRPKNQELASNLIIGQRMLPHVFIRAADARPYDIHDMLPADARFKVLVFAGDITDSTQRAPVEEFASDLARADSWFHRYAPHPSQIRNQIHGAREVSGYALFDVMVIGAGNKAGVNYTDFPAILRPHWSKVVLDDVDLTGRIGGGGYLAYGIGPDGAVVVVRPDRYVGAVAPLADGVRDLEGYFAGIFVVSNPPSS